MKTKQALQSPMKGSNSEKNLGLTQKSSSRMYQTQHQPFLSTILKKEGPSFIIKTAEIPEISRKIDFERLITRPKHKPDRMKFDQTRTECLKEKENNPQTA